MFTKLHHSFADPSFNKQRIFLPFVQFKKYGKQQWKGITFSKSATLLKVTLLHECFPLFENCTNGIKSRKASQIVQVSNNQEVKGSV